MDFWLKQISNVTEGSDEHTNLTLIFDQIIVFHFAIFFVTNMPEYMLIS